MNTIMLQISYDVLHYLSFLLLDDVQLQQSVDEPRVPLQGGLRGPRGRLPAGEGPRHRRAHIQNEEEPQRTQGKERRKVQER